MSNMRLSSGFKRDFLVLNFSIAILTIMVDDMKSDGVVSRESNKTHKLNKRIDNRLKTLRDRLKIESDNIYSSQDNGDLVKWMRHKTETKILTTLEKVEHGDVSLEYLALWILWQNFTTNERKFVKMSQDFDGIIDNLDYAMETIYLLDDTLVSSTEMDMADLAKSYIKMIKE